MIKRIGRIDMNFRKPALGAPETHLMIFREKIFKVRLFNHTGNELRCTRNVLNYEITPVVKYLLEENANFTSLYAQTVTYTIKCMSQIWHYGRLKKHEQGVNVAVRQVNLHLRPHKR